MKTTTTTLGLLGLITTLSTAGTIIPDIASPNTKTTGGGFEDARRPISNPTLFDLALPTTNIHAIYLQHRLPSRINTVGPNLPLGGDV